MLLLLLAGITVSADFEAGSVGKVELVSPTHLRCALVGELDQDQRNRQASWYYFRLDGLPHQEVIVELADLVGEYNYRPGAHSVTAKTRPVFSYDDPTWRHFSDREVEWDDQQVRLRLRFTPARSHLWIAHVPPYTTIDLKRPPRRSARAPCASCSHEIPRPRASAVKSSGRSSPWPIRTAWPAAACASTPTDTI